MHSPTEIQLSNDHLRENLAADTVVGKLQTNYAIGLNQNGPHTYSLVAGTGSDDNYRFTIIGKELHTKQSLDYEDKTPLSVRIRVVDGNKRSREQAFAIKIDNDSSEVIDSAPPRCAMSTQTEILTHNHKFMGIKNKIKINLNSIRIKLAMLWIL